MQHTIFQHVAPFVSYFETFRICFSTVPASSRLLQNLETACTDPGRTVGLANDDRVPYSEDGSCREGNSAIMLLVYAMNR